MNEAGAERLSRRWADNLTAWRIPESITSRVTESPWVLPEEVFASRAARQIAEPGGVSYERAREALGASGSVLDVGAGGGAASLPLAAWTTEVTAVDSYEPLLRGLRHRAGPLGLEPRLVLGTWPDVAPRTPVADVVVCHHVLYNVAHVEPFVAALTAHARRRVIVEITATHPLTALNPYWWHFHRLRRPAGPAAGLLIELLRALGYDVSAQHWTRPSAPEYADFKSLVEVTRRRLCLPPERAGEVAAELRVRGVSDGEPPDLGSSGVDLATIWWPGKA
jgi:SAM-dependent methyltransferase